MNYDRKKTEYINLFNLKSILSDLNISLDVQLKEFLIYYMKKFEDPLANLDEINYNNLLNLLDINSDDYEIEEDSKIDKELNSDVIESNSKSEQDTDNKIHINTDRDKGNDCDEVTLTVEQFNEKVDKVLSKIAEYLIKEKLNVFNYFTLNVTIIKQNENNQIIDLKDFLSKIQNMQIEISELEIYCIFTKLKVNNDEIEAIDLIKLKEEMQNYGIFDDLSSKSLVGFYELLEAFYLANNKGESIDEFYNSVLKEEIITVQNRNIIKYSNFLNIIKKNKIIANDYKMSDKSINEICNVEVEEETEPYLDIKQIEKNINSLNKNKENIPKNNNINQQLEIENKEDDKKFQEQDSDSINMDQIQDMDVSGLE